MWNLCADPGPPLTLSAMNGGANRTRPARLTQRQTGMNSKRHRLGWPAAVLMCSILLTVAPAPSMSSALVRAAGDATTLSPRGQQIQGFDLEVDDEGRYGITWGTIFSGNPGVTFRIRAAGGAWSKPVTFGKGRKTWHPQLAVTSKGRWVLAWKQERDDRSLMVRAAVRRADGSWTSPKTLGSAPRSQEIPFLGLEADAQGRALLTFVSMDDMSGTASLVGRTLGQDGSWGQAARTSTASGYGATASAAVSPSGTVYAAIPEDTMEGAVLAITTRPPDGPWSTPVRFDPPGDISGVTVVPTGPDAAQMHVVLADVDNRPSLWWADLAPDGTLTDPERVPGIGAGWSGLKSRGVPAHTDPDGGAVLFWADRAGVHWLPRSADGEWGTNDVLSTGGHGVDAAARADGRWTLVWDRGGNIVRRTQRADGTWAAAQSFAVRDPAGPQVAASPLGGIAVAWYRGVRLQAATFR